MSLAPTALCCLIIGLLLTRHYDEKLSAQSIAYGEARVQQLSTHLAEYVLHENTLSLAVLVSRLQAQGQIQSLEVYDINNRLLAQAGRDLGDGQSFTRDLAWQDSTLGHVRLTLLPPTLAPGHYVWLVFLSGMLLVGLLVWFAGDFIYLWLTEALATGGSTQAPVLKATRQQDTEGPSRQSVLVVKLRPSLYLKFYLERFVQAASLYQGTTELIAGDELMILFASPDAVSQAVNTGLLIRRLTELARGSITFGGAIDVSGDTGEEKFRKHASYLASIAEAQLLLTEAASQDVNRAEVVLQTFHHTLIDSVIYSISHLTDQSLLDRQAEDLNGQASIVS